MRTKALLFVAVAAWVVVWALFAMIVNAHAAEPWQTIEHDDGTELRHGKASVMCGTRCAVLLRPDAHCRPGAAYPVLVNTPARMGVMPARCVLTAIGGPPRPTLVITDPIGAIQQWLGGHDVAFAYPTIPGGIEVIPIPAGNFRSAAAGLADAVPSGAPAGDGDPV